MNIVVFDTETTSLDKPFCYNIGYTIVNEDFEPLCSRSFVVEQIWHNLPLFSSAYYADKRPLYVAEMRARRTTMDKFGYICQQMMRDFREHSVTTAFAYNSDFDDRVFTFNCDWFKCNNPFDTIPIKDIRPLAIHSLVDEQYKRFCDEHGYFTESGNYSTTAEIMYRYIKQNTEFIEAHTALDDAIIETDILAECAKKGADLNATYHCPRSIERVTERTLHIKTAEQTDYYFDYTKMRMNRERTEIILK